MQPTVEPDPLPSSEERRLQALAHYAAQGRVELFAGAIEAADDGIVILTAGQLPGEFGRIIYANEAYLRMKRAAFDDVVGSDAGRFFGARTDLAALASLRAKLVAGEASRLEYVSYRADGSVYHCEIAARPLLGADGNRYAVVIQRDVTFSALREISLELENERLTKLTSIVRGVFASLAPRALVDSIAAGVREISGGTARLFVRDPGGGFRATPDLALPIGEHDAGDDFVHAAASSEVALVSDDRRRAGVRIGAPADIAAYVLDVAAAGEPFVAADLFALNLLGQYVTVAIRNVALYDELAARRASVVELNQVKNDLIAMLAHDFKGPLTTIVGFADVLADDERFDPEAQQYLSLIRSSAMRLAALATDTLALSRLEQNELELVLGTVDVVALVRDIVRVFRVTRTIDLRSEATSMIVEGDAGRLRQVYENLIGNAIKYSPGGEPVEITLRRKNGCVEVAIRDRGIGIPPRDIGKLFGRFARAGNARELGIGGTGFGLYLARRIVEMHGGTIEVQSKLGAGSTFRAGIPETLPARRTPHRRLVLLDAEGDGRSFVAHSLRADGFAVSVVDDAFALLDALDHGTFDAAIVDVDLVRVPAAEFIARVGARTALVRVASDDRPADAGWAACVRKPFLLTDLQSALAAALERTPPDQPAG